MSAEIVVFPAQRIDRRLRLVEQLEKTPESKSRVQRLAEIFRGQVSAINQAEEVALEKKRASGLLALHLRQMVRLGGPEWVEHEVAEALAEMRRMQF